MTLCTMCPWEKANGGETLLEVGRRSTWSAEGRREELREILMRRSDLHTGGVVASSQTTAVLHHTVQAGIQRLR